MGDRVGDVRDERAHARVHARRAAQPLATPQALDDEDLEGYSARLNAWRALLYGPVFLVRLHMRGFRLGRRRHRRWILVELATGALWVYFVFALSGGLRALVPRGGHGGRPVHDLLLRRVDRAPRLRPLAPDRTHPPRESEKQDLLRDVLPPGASPLSESADLSPVQARRAARQRRSRTASSSDLLNPSQEAVVLFRLQVTGVRHRRRSTYA